MNSEFRSSGFPVHSGMCRDIPESNTAAPCLVTDKMPQHKVNTMRWVRPWMEWPGRDLRAKRLSVYCPYSHPNPVMAKAKLGC